MEREGVTRQPLSYGKWKTFPKETHQRFQIYKKLFQLDFPVK